MPSSIDSERSYVGAACAGRKWTDESGLSELCPGAATIRGFQNTCSVIRVQVILFTRPYVNGLSVRWIDGNRTDRERRLAIRQRIPRSTAIRCLPNSANRAAQINMHGIRGVYSNGGYSSGNDRRSSIG